MKKYISILLAFVCCGILYAANYPTHKEIDKTSNPQYLKRADAAWQGRARLVGALNNPPLEFSISFYLVSKPDEVVFTQKFTGNISVYESDWLSAGQYHVVIKAAGYSQHKLNKINLKAGHDCVIDIYFGSEEYNGRAN